MAQDTVEPSLLSRSQAVPLLLAALVSLVTIMVMVYVDGVERQRRLEEVRGALGAHLSAVRAKLELGLNEPLARSVGMAAQIVANEGITEEQFQLVAEELLRNQKGVRNIVVSRGLVIVMTYPLKGNESIIGVDFRNVPVQYEQVQKAIAARQPMMQGPVPLIQGGTGLVLRNPVFLRDGLFFGMANIVLDIPAIFREAGLDDPDLPFQLAIRGRDGKGVAGEMILGDEALFKQTPVEADVTLVYGTWHMAAVPKDGWDTAQQVPLTTRLIEALVVLTMIAVSFGAAMHMIGQDRAEIALLNKSRELERSNADLERFAYIASHDLQTPLRNVVSYAQLLARRYRGRLDEDADDFIGYIVEGSNRMWLMIQDLLHYARLSNNPVGLELVEAQAALENAADNLSLTLQNAKAQLVCAEPLPRVLAHHQQLVSLFQNLLENAVKYADPDRPATISVTAKPDQPGWVRFAVADNGIGIDPEYFERIFVVFQRLHTPGDRTGTGIGLATCQRIVQNFGGGVWGESTPGQGATFFFTVQAG
mgnify:CR=1 FL=1